MRNNKIEMNIYYFLIKFQLNNFEMMLEKKEKKEEEFRSENTTESLL